MFLYPYRRAAESHCAMHAVLPHAFDEFRGRDGSIAITVSPLKALMKN